MTVDTQHLRRLAKVLCIRTATDGEMIEIQEAADQIDTQAAEIEALKHDIAEYVRIASEQGAEIERLREALEELIGWQTTAPERVVDAARAAQAQPVVNQQMTTEREAFRRLLEYAESQICMHEETHRGGAIWEICDQCGAKWADDEGGKPEFAWPKEIADARAALAQEGP